MLAPDHFRVYRTRVAYADAQTRNLKIYHMSVGLIGCTSITSVNTQIPSTSQGASKMVNIPVYPQLIRGEFRRVHGPGHQPEFWHAKFKHQ